MTERQVQLIAAEILRQRSIAATTDNDVLMRSHLEVADALDAALRAAGSQAPKRKVHPRRRLQKRRAEKYNRRLSP